MRQVIIPTEQIKKLKQDKETACPAKVLLHKGSHATQILDMDLDPGAPRAGYSVPEGWFTWVQILTQLLPAVGTPTFCHLTSVCSHSYRVLPSILDLSQDQSPRQLFPHPTLSLPPQPVRSDIFLCEVGHEDSWGS